jgi:S1-C subfamily serine protease
MHIFCSTFRTRLLVFVLLLLFNMAGIAQGQGTDTDEQDEALWKVFEDIRPSVVTLRAFDANDRLRNVSSGFIVSDDGLIATNLKLLDGISRIEMQTADERTRDIHLIAATDSNWGIALLRSADKISPRLTLKSDSRANIGDDIIVIGSPQGINVTLSQGSVVSFIEHRGNDRLMQISNDFSPGMIGGPVLNESGEVVGILTFVMRSGRPAHLAVPVDVVLGMMETSLTSATERDLKPLQRKIAELKTQLDELRQGLEAQCSDDDIALIDSVIRNAIKSGAVIFNKGDTLACFRIYEGASYQILYRIHDRCKIASRFLEKTLFEAATIRDPGQYDSLSAARAWIMRGAFDSLTGDRNRPIEGQQAISGTRTDDETGT